MNIKNMPKVCPNCQKTSWLTSDHPYFLQKTIKDKEGKYDVKINKGMVVRTYVCKDCSYLVFFKEQYDQDLV